MRNKWWRIYKVFKQEIIDNFTFIFAKLLEIFKNYQYIIGYLIRNKWWKSNYFINK